jgi:CheY-like chemotaxis protein
LLSDDRSSPLTILVVDDEPALRSFAGILLEELGYSAMLAESGRAAVQLLLQDTDAVAAVLLDMTMPGLSPEETVRLLREIRSDLPVVILSGDLEKTVRDRFVPGTINGYIQKPYTDAELEAALLQALVQPASREPTPFKLARLSEDDIDEVKQEYLIKCRHDLPVMADLLAARDFEALQIAGHSLKGSGGCFGFSELTQLGRALEDYAQASDAASCGEQLDRLKDFLEHFVS